MAEVKLGRYRHYKNKDHFYQVTGFVHGVETQERMVLYRPLYRVEDLYDQYGDDLVFARSCKIFSEKVDIDGVMVPRFEYVGE